MIIKRILKDGSVKVYEYNDDNQKKWYEKNAEKLRERARINAQKRYQKMKEEGKHNKTIGRPRKYLNNDNGESTNNDNDKPNSNSSDAVSK